MDLNFDPDDLTLGDLEDFEDIVGMPYSEAIKQVNEVDEDGEVVRDEKGRPVKTVTFPTKAMIAVVYIILRRKNPDFTVADARNVRIGTLEWGSPESDPKESGSAIAP